MIQRFSARRPTSTAAPAALGAIALLALLAAGVGCEQATPRITFQSMAIQRLGLDATDYMATCQVDNPNPHAMHIDEVHWTLSSGTTELVAGEVLRSTELPGSKTVPFHIHLQVPYRQLDRAGLIDRRQFEYDLRGQFRIGSALGPIDIPFSNSGRMPIVHSLRIELVGVEFLGLSETRVGLALVTEVANTNDLFLVPSQLAGHLLVNERPLIEVDVDLAEEKPIAPHGSSRLRIPVWVNSPEVGVRTLSKMVTAPDTRFRLLGAMTFRVPGTGDVNDLLVDPTAGPITAPPAQPD